MVTSLCVCHLALLFFPLYLIHACLLCVCVDVIFVFCFVSRCCLYFFFVVVVAIASNNYLLLLLTIGLLICIFCSPMCPLLFVRDRLALSYTPDLFFFSFFIHMKWNDSSRSLVYWNCTIMLTQWWDSFVISYPADLPLSLARSLMSSCQNEFSKIQHRTDDSSAVVCVIGSNSNESLIINWKWKSLAFFANETKLCLLNGRF